MIELFSYFFLRISEINSLTRLLRNLRNFELSRHKSPLKSRFRHLASIQWTYLNWCQSCLLYFEFHDVVENTCRKSFNLSVTSVFFIKNRFKPRIVKMKKQSKVVSLNGQKKNVNVANGRAGKLVKANGKGGTTDKKWAKLSLDEFINSSASEDDDSNNEEELTDDSDGEVSDAEESEELDEEEEDESMDEDEGGESGDEASMEEDDQESNDEEDSEEDSGDEVDEKTAVKKHKKTLNKLKESDPEFYQFLSENDRALLEFGSSDDSDDEERGGQVHELPDPDELVVGSDESDFEDEESAAKRQANVITQAMVDKWQQELQDPKYETSK